MIITEPFVDQERSDTPKIMVDPKPVATTEEEGTTLTQHTNGSENRVEPISIYTTNKNSVIELRQEIAARLADKEDAVISKATFSIYLEKGSVELNTLPNMMRGQLTGISDIHFDLTISQTGSFSKSKLEQMAEQLPVFQEASYKAELKGFVKSADLVKNEK